MNSKGIYDMTDAATSMVATLLFANHMDRAEIQEILNSHFSDLIATDQEVPFDIQQQMRIPPGLPFVLVPTPVFSENKKAMMKVLEDIVRVPGPAIHTLKELPRMMGLEGSARTAKLAEMVTVTSSKLFELCLGRYCEKVWQQRLARAKGNEMDYGLVLLGGDD
jgi:hypothetical protein